MAGREGQFYLTPAVVAMALLVMPLMTLGGSAARPSARRRDERLSTLRLLGARVSTVAVMTIAESALFASVGALVGIIGHLLLVPLVQLIPFRVNPSVVHRGWIPGSSAWWLQE